MNVWQRHFAHIVIDSPPAASFTDGVLLSAVADGVLLVVHGGTASRHIVRRTKQLLADVGAKIFGVVLNNVASRVRTTTTIENTNGITTPTPKRNRNISEYLAGIGLRQRTETEDRGQKSTSRDQKRARGPDHAAKHLADFPSESSKLIMLLVCDVATILSKIQRGIGFVVFTIAIS